MFTLATPVPPVAPAAPAVPAAPAERATMLLRALGIVGYDELDPIFLAALALREPLLLVSEHGAAKSLLLERLADALGLRWRHYNASLLQFDDLAGFPIPDEQGGIRYASGPGAVWDAQAVFIDELGRCRPEMANKLFPLVHEKRLQGIALTQLEYRWAATNPVPEAQNPTDAVEVGRYEGLEPLDPALADRFGFVITLPRFADLSAGDQQSIISGIGTTPDAEAPALLRRAVAAARELLPVMEEQFGATAVQYVQAVIPELRTAKLPIGGRRAATLKRVIVAVRAASLVLHAGKDEHACWLALRHALPDTARRHFPRAVLKAAHVVAWRAVLARAETPEGTVRAVTDPLGRVLLAATIPGIKPIPRGRLLADAWSALAEWQRAIIGWHLVPHLLSNDLVPAAVTGTIAEVVLRIAAGNSTVRGQSHDLEFATLLRSLIADARELDGHAAGFVCNVILTKYSLAAARAANGSIMADAQLDEVLTLWRRAADALAPTTVAHQ